MAFLDRVLQEPSYKWENENGEVVKPSVSRLFQEAFYRINVFKDKRNWISAISWLMVIFMLPFFYFFLTRYISIPLVLLFLLYAMIIMSTHGTIWFHRFCTHNSYSFSHKIWRFITQNLVIKTFPEEIYVISHHVHHAKSDEAGDPYNSTAGFWYCMLSDVNHQSLAKDLSESDYNKAAQMMQHTGVVINSYQQFKDYGSVAHPLYTVALWLGNWAFWFAAFYLLGGFALVCTMFSAAMFWFVFVRAFNYTGHGKGEEKHVDGVDYDRSNLSINQLRPGLFSGEWHNNHHLYPGSARSGFLNYQLDLAWYYIFGLYKLGLVNQYQNNRQDFMDNYVNEKQMKDE